MEIVTFDWPPFASWAPHYGHALVSIMKDALSRFKTMQWYRVQRIRWRDCHGLPVEKFVEKELWIDGKKDIEEKIGVEKFVEACRSTVRNVNSEWKTFVDMIGRWSDMDNAYFTMDLDYMESVMWVFNKLYDKNLIYKWFSVQWYCPSCATSLSNSEVNEWYQDRQDPTVTVKFPLYQKDDTYSKNYQHTPDWATDVVACVIKKDDNYLLAYHKKWQKYIFPGGKVELWQTLEDAARQELQEELGVEIIKAKKLWSRKNTVWWKLRNIHQVEVEIKGEPQNMEPEKCTHITRAQVVPTDNELWIGIKIENTIIDDADEIRQQFSDLYLYHIGAHKHTKKEANMYFLAWTTTPRTLPSNMFLAVWPDIDYASIWDKEQKEYYILAKDLLSSYYKSPDEYIIINTNKGEDIVAISYRPIRNFYEQSKNIAEKYKKLVHKVLPWDFVTTESGTGVVHIAPAFGQDDFDIVKTIFPKDDAQKWLFLPVDDYAEFTDDVPNWKWVRCYDANKDIIQDLKKNNIIVTQNTMNHSYPHCRRCDTPLIYKAMTSWFIKEQHIAQDNIPSVENISFTPETIKNRFRDILKSAPDWNVSRNRYRWAPLPIRQSENDQEDRIVIKNIDELYTHSKTGSANITRNILVVNASTEKNKQTLNKTGQKQSKNILKILEDQLEVGADTQVVMSPSQTSRETIYPYIQSIYTANEQEEISTKRKAIHKNYTSLLEKDTYTEYMQNDKNTKYFSLADGFAIDFRIADGEKNTWFLQEINDRYKTKTIIIVWDEENIYNTRHLYRAFDKKHQRQKYFLTHGNIATHYRDNDRNTEIDLHKPYIDNYWFEYKGNKYRRIPEVLDCRFESWSMPYGQVNYTGEKGNKLNYPADFIIEWLDQTRGRFRTLHILGQGMMGKNAFNNVIINGLLLAEDGKKMSKRLKNYPEPSYLLAKYGTDALRMYLLASPAVRAEPVRLWETMVEQMYKDFTAPLTNAYNFFETYAKIDKFKTNNNVVHYINQSITFDRQNNDRILRINADLIIQLDKQTNISSQIQNLCKNIQKKHTEIIVIQSKDSDRYNKLLKQHQNKNIIIIGDSKQYAALRNQLYGKNNANPSRQIVPLPNYHINNDLDRWIRAAVHQSLHEIENAIETYTLDIATKEIITIIDKLTNRYIRRSRRRFWASGMSEDKISAYHTLYNSIKYILYMAAPFAPFITEYLRQKLQTFGDQSKEKTAEQISIHLWYLPIASPQYIDEQLLEEIELVRHIISLWLFVRSKNNMKIKQPLASLSVRIE